MTAAAPPPPRPAGDFALNARDLDKLAALRRMKIIATALLVLSIGLMIVGKVYEHHHPVFGFVAAFGEAATIGALADWYAVVALFRRPMGLPIPHTAIIPKNQDRIADSLGNFIETHFLSAEPVGAKLRQVNFAGLIADWLSEPQKSARLAAFAARMLPGAVASVDQSGLKAFVAARVVEQVDRIKVAPLAAQLLTSFTDDGRHQRLLDDLLGAIEKVIADQTTLDALREKIRNELPSLFNLFQADAFLLKRIVNSLMSFLGEVRDDPDHALRGEFDVFVKGFIENLRSSPEYAERAEKLKRDLLKRKELSGLAQDMWSSVLAYVDRDLASDESVIEAKLASLLVDLGAKLRRDTAFSAEINDGFVTALQTFVEAQKSGVSRFVADQVKAWDMQRLVRLIEINIGRDLQYIRLNGTLIGGSAGLFLHAVELLIKGA